MCGKFTQMASWRNVHAFSRPLIETDSEVISTPMRFANIIRLNESGEREVVSMRWGFAGKGDANPSRPKHMHARSETIERLPTFANAFTYGRGILVVHTFNEGEELPNGKTKQWVITPNDGKPIAIAVICEKWTNGADTLDTFIQVTTPANALIAKITDRMPAILQPEDWPTWLCESDAALADVKAVLRTYEDTGNWTMTEQEPARKAKPRKSDPQPGLF
ncbi:SOS response-associated peptidase family protein [Hyphomicrobium sp. 2TAF46]|uniref:SOS response-associated peptidase family protein n=1 Tax=Hyphomicrobium sp. 2TAF46 TaxID=3233019 RepID=UPI003F8F6343